MSSFLNLQNASYKVFPSQKIVNLTQEKKTLEEIEMEGGFGNKDATLN